MTILLKIRSKFCLVGIGVIALTVIGTSCLLNTETTLCVADLHCPPGWVCTADRDACTNDGCGDSFVFVNNEEICDDGNRQDGDGCSADCKSDETCGNGVMDLMESCDHGILNGTPEDNCSVNCILADCGNGTVDVNEECDPGSKDSPGCNSFLNGPESSHCKFARCGDEYTNEVAGEECDVGLTSSRECNSPTCLRSRCGDDFYNPISGEQCDTGRIDTQACNGNNTNDPRIDCQVPRCGDGYVNMHFAPSGPGTEVEICDDGNKFDCGTCKVDCTQTAEPENRSIIMPRASELTQETAYSFSLGDGTSSIILTYMITTTQPQDGRTIVLTPADDANTIANKTKNKVNSLSLRVTADDSLPGVTFLSADQLGNGKLVVSDVSLVGKFVITGLKMSTGIPCGNTIGCRFNMDCISYNCQQNTCQS
jgi:cysteine-rich repeat protein